MKIISCREAVSRIFELLDGMIKRSQKQELDEHLDTCRDCCNRLEFEKLLKEKLMQLSVTKTPKRLSRRIEKLLKNFSGTF